MLTPGEVAALPVPQSVQRVMDRSRTETGAWAGGWRDACRAVAEMMREAEGAEPPPKEVHVVLAEIPNPGSARPPAWEFVETETPDGRGVVFESHTDPATGYRRIVIPVAQRPAPSTSEIRRIVDACARGEYGYHTAVALIADELA